MAGGYSIDHDRRLLLAIDRNEPGRPDASTVLVIDESGTAGTRDLARLLDEVARSGAKAVLAGDAKQLRRSRRVGCSPGSANASR